MRKFYLVLTVLFLFSALLTGCGTAKPSENIGESVSAVNEETSQLVSEEELSASQPENSTEEQLSPSKSAGSSKKPAASSQQKEEKQQQNTLPPADVSQPEQPADVSQLEQPAVQQQQSSTQQQEETPLPPSSSSAETENTLPAGKIKVYFSVECSNAVEVKNEIALSVAPNGIILPKTEMLLDENATVYDALKNSGLVISAQKSPFGMYVLSIQSLAQKACGQNSGWVYTVNGNNINVSCSAYKLRNGDEVRWFYTLG